MDNEPGSYSELNPDHATATTCEPMLLAPEDIKLEPPLDIPPEQNEPPATPPPSTSKPVRSFLCDRGCGKSFFKEVDLARHQASVCTDATCSVCGQVFKSHRWLRSHMVSRHSDVNPYECRVTSGCLERFNKLKDQREHEIICGKGKRVPLERRCSICDKTFRTVEVRIVHESKCGLTTTCQICGITTVSIQSMVYHMNKHRGLAPFPCRKGGGCSERFSGPESRNSHEATCNAPGQNELPCLNCGECFANHTKLLKHFKLCQFERNVDTASTSTEPIKQEPQQSDGLCQGCGQQFPSAGALSIHQVQCKLMTTCHICNKEFTKNQNLIYHMNSHYGLLPFECRVTPGCPLRFATPHQRLRHQLKCGAEMRAVAGVHCKKEPGSGVVLPAGFRCEICNESFPNGRKRNAHQMYCGLTTTCAVCGKTTSTIQTMSYHMNMHKGIKPYECREDTGCGFSFYSPGSRNFHEKVCQKNHKKAIDVPVVAENPIACPEPETSQNQATSEEFVTVQIKQEVEPVAEHSNTPTLEVKRCPGCRKSFSSEEFLSQHRKFCVATGECWFCGLKFANRDSLRNHLKKHKGSVNPFKCRVTPGCTARFYHSSRRYYHESDCGQYGRPGGSSGNDELKSLECASCGKKFASPAVLSKHHVRCNVSKVCLICGREMASFASLQYHMNKHRGLMPFKCSYCPAKYSTPGGRNGHELNCYARKTNPAGNTKSRFSTICDRCGQDFRTARRLRKHRNNCNVSKTCGKCGQVLRSNGALRAHMNRHNGVKPYQCRESSQCGARFPAANQRNLHERRCAFKAKTSEGSVQITCKGCGKSFVKAVHLQSHELLCVSQELALDPEEEDEEELADPDAALEIQESPEEATWSNTSCVTCGASFVSKELQRKHMRSCGVKKTCTVCMKPVAIGYLNYHMNKHSGIKPYRCRVRDGCPAEFYGPSLRSKHERICRGPENANPEQSKCGRCGKELDRRTMVHVCEGLERVEEEKDAKVKVVKWSFSKEVKPKQEFVEQSSVEGISVEVKVDVEKVDMPEEKETVDEAGLLEVTHDEPAELTFSCEACGKEFSSGKFLTEHTSSCDKALPYQCRLSAECPERFANAQYRRNHEVICSKSRRLSGKSAKVELVACRNCGKVCNGKQLLRVHKELCGPEVELPEELRCTVCPEVCDSVDNLQEHLDKHNLGEKLLKCRASANCSESFKQARTRIEHELECTAAGQTICSKCYKLLPNPETLEEHEESCQADEFICRLCDASYSDLHNLRKHLLNHDNPGQNARWWEKPTPNPVMPNRERYSCEHCGLEFLTQEDLQKHPPFCKLVYRCTQCPAAFSQLHSLRYHENMHSGLKPFSCRKEGCEKRFRNPCHRRNHEKVCGTSKEAEHLKKIELIGSSAAKLFPCPHCTATFKAINELKYHVNEHKADKKYPCRQSESCKETFTTRGFRLKHEAICGKLAAPKQPRKVELIACKDCGKVFSNLQYLRIHKQKCAGSDGPPTNLKCTLCEVISPDVDALQVHLDKHNREKPFQCRVSKNCSEAYINERQRANHEFVCNADGQVICQRCFKLCPCLETLKAHEKTCRATEFPCRLCEVILRSRNSQLVHYLRHDDKKIQMKTMHACPCCDKQFLKRINFLLHLKEHNIDPNDLELKCEICAAKFKTTKAMEVHMNCHKGIKSYKCRYQGCEEAFFQSTAREVHEQNCTKLSLTCDICEIKLACMRDYQQHIKSHDALNNLEAL